jgi:hypothetical protein
MLYSDYHFPVAHESSYSMLPGWQCDFYIGYGYGISMFLTFFSLHFLFVLFLVISMHCFHICYPFLVVVDVIEEDALNEKSCIQVLRILITKADTEIDELEQDLVSLQSQLALAEHEEWPELCCNALTEKINCLDISIRSLKNTDENDIEVQLLMHKEPAERVHEIVRVLLTNYFQEKDEQV